MDETLDVEDWWIAADYHVEPWIVAAAHAGDTRAMLFIADRVSYRSTLAECLEETEAAAVEAAAAATRRGKARWYQQAAQHGSTEAPGKLASYIRSDHLKWHERRRIRKSFHGFQITPGPDDLELCQGGASLGEVDCAQVWEEHLRRLQTSGQGEQEEEDPILRELKEVIRESHCQEFVIGHIQFEVVTTAVITATLVPFIQAMITTAGADSYGALRKYLQNLFRRSVRQNPAEKDQLLVIEDPEHHSAVLQIWTDLPDEAITALSQLIHDMRTGPQTPGIGQRWYWNGAAHRWQVLLAVPAPPREATPSQPDEPGLGQYWYRWDITTHRWQVLQISHLSQRSGETSSELDAT